ncbi:DUF4124 domain-containing protein [Aquisalimonas sp.]|uniref:DUF4124 domain-containing protein n=1 Tax=Aquisalimonas sp. TaxID=1872621 RepID=UPI0025C1F4FA|nr:DUF4124 domain-containing protein [Aquisalimonas sp.]
MNLKWLIFLLCLAPAAALTGIYTWVDEDGVVVYSDEPREGAERLERLEPQRGFEFRAPERRSRPVHQDAEHDSVYEAVEITSPSDGETVRDNQGLVDVRVRLEPGLRPGHYVQLVLNGEPRGEPEAATTIRLTGVHRGEYRVATRIVNAAGDTVAESGTVTFYMHQASRLIPGGGPGSQGGGSQNPGGVAFPGN